MITLLAHRTFAGRATVRPAASRTHVLLIGNLHRVGDALCRACAPGVYRLSLVQDPRAGLIQARRAGHRLIVLDVFDLAQGVALYRNLRHGGSPGAADVARDLALLGGPRGVAGSAQARGAAAAFRAGPSDPPPADRAARRGGSSRAAGAAHPARPAGLRRQQPCSPGPAAGYVHTPQPR